MSHVLHDFVFEAVLLQVLIAAVTLTLGQNTYDNHDEEYQSCVEAGEMCLGMNECCPGLDCDINEPVARCVNSIEIADQNEEYENSGRALIEESSQPAKNTLSSVSKLTLLKENIMNLFKHSDEASTTDRLVPTKILNLDGFTYNNFKTTNRLSPLFNTLFFKNKIKSSFSTSSDSSSSSE